jgi:hypothetical protein
MQLNENGLYDIYSMYYVPFWQRAWFVYILALVVILFSLYTVYSIIHFWLTKRKKNTPWQTALARLDAIRVNNAMPEKHAASIYAIMTDVLKEYIQGSYGLNVRHLTDYECIDYLRCSGLDRILVERLCTIFEDASAIKFAQHPAAAEVINGDLQHIRDFIHATRSARQSSAAIK